jgi:hypothetical protein
MAQERDVYSELECVLFDPSGEPGRSIIQDADEIYVTLDTVLVDPSTHIVDPDGTWEEWNSLSGVQVIDNTVSTFGGPILVTTDFYGRICTLIKTKKVHNSVKHVYLKIKLSHELLGDKKKHIVITLRDKEQYYRIDLANGVLEFTEEPIEN